MAYSGDSQSDGGNHTRVVHDVRNGHDQADHEDRGLQLLPGTAEFLDSLTPADIGGQDGDECSDQNCGTGAPMVFQVKTAVKCLGGTIQCRLDALVNPGDGESQGTEGEQTTLSEKSASSQWTRAESRRTGR